MQLLFAECDIVIRLTNSLSWSKRSKKFSLLKIFSSTSKYLCRKNGLKFIGFFMAKWSEIQIWTYSNTFSINRTVSNRFLVDVPRLPLKTYRHTSLFTSCLYRLSTSLMLTTYIQLPLLLTAACGITNWDRVGQSVNVLVEEDCRFSRSAFLLYLKNKIGTDQYIFS